MLAWWCATVALLLTLSILDARIMQYETQLATRNLTIGSRLALQQSLTFHRNERYKILEEIDD